MLKKLFFLPLFFIITTSVLAGELPKGVTPEQGKAWTLSPVYEAFDGSYAGDSYLELSFWNVGQLSGDPNYSKAVLSNNCSKSTTTGCGEGIPKEGAFTGGPDGIIMIGGNEYKLKEGKYFENISGGKTSKYTLENPQIFDAWYKDPKPAEKTEQKREDSGTRFSDLTGQVEWRPDDDEEDWHFAKLGDVLPYNAHIRTSEDSESSAVLSFPNLSTFTLKPGTEIILDTKPKTQGQLKLLFGTFKANVTKIIKEGSLDIEMNQAVAGIKGTTFVLEETKETSTIKVIEGSVSFTSKTSGKTEMVNTGERLLADKNGLSPKTAFDVATEQAAWDVLEKKAKKVGFQFNNNMIYAVLGILLLVIIGIVLKSKIKKRA